MTNKKIDYHLYLGFLKSKQGDVLDVKFSSEPLKFMEKDDGEKLGKLASKHLESKPVKIDDDNDLSNNLSQLLSKFENALSAYRPLIDLTGSLFQAIYAQVPVKNFLNTATEKFDLLDENDHEQLYGVPMDHHAEASYLLKEVNGFRSAIDVIPSSILLSLVATFDSILAEFITVMLRTKPELFAADETKFSLKDLMELGSFEEAKERVTCRKVENLMRGSHKDQVEYLDKHFGIGINDYAKISEYYEIFERRNLVAHGSCLVNSIYISKSKELGFYDGSVSIGDKLELSRDYLSASTNISLEFGILLIFSVWKNECKGDIERIYGRMSEISYSLIKIKNYTLAADILSFCISSSHKGVSDKILKMMTVNLANAYKNMGEDQKCTDTINSVDWSATTEDFKICVAVLRDKVAEVVELMDIKYHSKKITKNDFREWPVFAWIQSDTLFTEKYESLYGEIYTEAVSENPDISEDSQNAEPVTRTDQPFG